MIKFEKISFEQFLKDFPNSHYSIDDPLELDELKQSIYDKIQLPRRSTKNSAGYDFFNPFMDFTVPKNGGTLLIPTGIRCIMPSNAVLLLAPRSGLGFKTSIRLSNTLGVIDADYYGAENEGHIMIKLTNNSSNDVIIPAEKAFAQGIFVNYLITDDDSAEDIRTGGFGSTTK